MKYKWNDTPEQLKKVTGMGIDRLKLEEACEAAAMKIYPVYRDFNLEMGDKVPTLYYLTQIIFELAVGQIADGADDQYSWGGISLEVVNYADEGEEPNIVGVNIGFHLKSIRYEDIAK